MLARSHFALGRLPWESQEAPPQFPHLVNTQDDLDPILNACNLSIVSVNPPHSPLGLISSVIYTSSIDDKKRMNQTVGGSGEQN